MKVVPVVLVVKATICVTGAVCQGRLQSTDSVKSVQDTTVGQAMDVVVTTGYWLLLLPIYQ